MKIFIASNELKSELKISDTNTVSDNANNNLNEASNLNDEMFQMK